MQRHSDRPPFFKKVGMGEGDQAHRWIASDQRLDATRFDARKRRGQYHGRDEAGQHECVAAHHHPGDRRRERELGPGIGQAVENDEDQRQKVPDRPVRRAQPRGKPAEQAARHREQNDGGRLEPGRQIGHHGKDNLKPVGRKQEVGNPKSE